MAAHALLALDPVTIQLARSHHLVVVAGQTARALLDVDIARSLNLVADASAPQGFTLLPTIRAANLAHSGSIAGAVRSDDRTPADTSDDAPLANATVTATSSGTTVTTYTDAQGVHVLPGLDAGDWDLLLQATGHDDLARPAVTVASRQQTTVDAVLVQQ